jgi:hypothetical protein
LAARIQCAVLFVFWLGGCAAAAPAMPPCPDGFWQDPPRAVEILGALATSEEGEALLANAGPLRLCFGAISPSQVITDGVLLLDTTRGAPETAARVGHLLVHLKERALFDHPPADKQRCGAWVEAVLGAEGRAYAVELRLAQALGVEVSYPFAAAFWKSEPASREAKIASYLKEHSEGGAGLAPLATDYAHACAVR